MMQRDGIVPNQRLPLKWECDCKLCANRCEWENLCHIRLWLTIPLSDCDASSVSSVCSYAGTLRNMKQTEPRCRLLSALLKCHQAERAATSRAQYFFAFVRQGKSAAFQITCELMRTNWFHVKPRICFFVFVSRGAEHKSVSSQVTYARRAAAYVTWPCESYESRQDGRACVCEGAASPEV